MKICQIDTTNLPPASIFVDTSATAIVVARLFLPERRVVVDFPDTFLCQPYSTNEMEYFAIEAGIVSARGVYRDGPTVPVFSDSQLAVRQINGEYQVNAPHLQVHVRWVRALVATIKEVLGIDVPIVYVARENNLAGRCIDNDIFTNVEEFCRFT